MADYTLPLSRVGPREIALVGGKGAGLGALIDAGFPVPEGFVVTTAAYRDFLDVTGLAGRPAAELHERIPQVPVPERIAASVLAAYAGIDGAVAVRSSGTAEDLADASFAGQHDTYLAVDGGRASSTPSATAGPRSGRRERSPTASARGGTRASWRWPSSSRRWWTPSGPGCCSPPIPSAGGATTWWSRRCAVSARIWSRARSAVSTSSWTRRPHAGSAGRRRYRTPTSWCGSAARSRRCSAARRTSSGPARPVGSSSCRPGR